MDSIFLDLFVFFFGLIVGSFLTCLIYRMELKEKGESASPLRGRSFCPKCKHTLAWYDLIPVLSFFSLRGKCRYCKQGISWSYPSIEILTAILFVWLWNIVILRLLAEGSRGMTGFFAIAQNDNLIGFLALLGMTVYLFAIASLLIIVFVYDLKHFVIPDSVIFSAIALVLVIRIWDLIGHWSLGIGNLETWNFFLAGFGAMIFFLIIFLASRGKWMGFGDVKLAFLMGLLLGFPNILVALFFAFLIGAVLGLALVMTKKKGLKSEVPFGPFLVLGVFISLFWGEKIITWYLNLINF